MRGINKTVGLSTTVATIEEALDFARTAIKAGDADSGYEAQRVEIMAFHVSEFGGRRLEYEVQVTSTAPVTLPTPPLSAVQDS